MLFWPIKVAIKVVSFVVTAVVVYFLISAVQVDLAASHAATSANAPSASAIVLLGQSAPGGAPGTSLADRLDTTAQLYAAHHAPRVIVTGYGSTTADPGVIATATSWLTSHGVPMSAISTVDAKDGAGGLRGAAALLGKGTPVLVVTDAVDALWAGGAASEAGLSPDVVAAEGSKGGVDTKFGPLATQASGVAAGRVVGDLHVPWAAK